MLSTAILSAWQEQRVEKIPIVLLVIFLIIAALYLSYLPMNAKLIYLLCARLDLFLIGIKFGFFFFFFSGSFVPRLGTFIYTRRREGPEKN